MIQHISTASDSQTIENTLYRYLDTKFKRQLLRERVLSYNSFYGDSNSECNAKRSLSIDEQNNFNTISKLLPKLREKIVSYPKDHFHGRGIVLTVGPNQFKLAQINLKMIELTDTKLPIQIWYSSSQISGEKMLTLIRVVPNLNVSVCCFITAECRTLTQVWELNATYVYKPLISGSLGKPFPYKPAAIISDTFEQVLFLDCDSYLTRDPDELFLYDPMYLKFGALFFPDAYKSRQHPAVWKLFNTHCTQNEYELDSSAILVDKRRVWDGLFFTKIMNDEHEIFYKYVSEGDKDTFRFGFRYMQNQYYLVMTPCSTGLFNGTHFCGLTLCKTDSLSQHIYINHVHLLKYEPVDYSTHNLAYTRIGLGDPNNNSFFFQHCRLPYAPTTCFHILKDPNDQRIQGKCYYGSVNVQDIEDRVPTLLEPLLSEKSKGNRVLMSKTHNIMPYFVENFIRIQQLISSN